MQKWIKDQFEWYRDNKNIITVSRTADMLSWDGFLLYRKLLRKVPIK